MRVGTLVFPLTLGEMLSTFHHWDNVCCGFITFWTSQVAQTVKCLSTMRESQVWSLGWEEPLRKGIATHSSILARRAPWTEEPGGPQSTGSQSQARLSDLTLITLFLVFTVMLWVRDNHHYYFISGENHGPGGLSIRLVIPGLWEHKTRRSESSQIWLQGHIWSVTSAASLYAVYPFWRPGPFIQYFLSLYGGPRLVAVKQGRHVSCLCRVSRLSFLYREVWSQFRESQLTLQREDTGIHQTSWYFTKPLWNCVFTVVHSIKHIFSCRLWSKELKYIYERFLSWEWDDFEAREILN